MLNFIWAFMIIIGIVYGAFTGRMAELSNAAIESAKDAVSLCITMLGIVSLWVGLMEIAKSCGLIEKLTKMLEPFIHFLFPKIPRGHKSLEYISLNTIANILGLGWAATPAGLKAMEELANLEKERRNPEYITDLNRTSGLEEVSQKQKNRSASDEMCIFLILNISSLQLIPVNIIAYRSQYGSVNPTSIIVPAIIATSINTIVAILFCKIVTAKKKLQKGI
ncbi:MAG: nucleoside recognition protein [Lachnospiraceae bacterium]|nr:nucleoside recognition protein [Lachnospiraceae bacterium]